MRRPSPAVLLHHRGIRCCPRNLAGEDHNVNIAVLVATAAAACRQVHKALFLCLHQLLRARLRLLLPTCLHRLLRSVQARYRSDWRNGLLA